jgi:hypothetical protein
LVFTGMAPTLVLKVVEQKQKSILKPAETTVEVLSFCHDFYIAIETNGQFCIAPCF